MVTDCQLEFPSFLHRYNRHRDNTVSIRSNKNARTSLLPFPHKKLAYLLKRDYLYCSRCHLVLFKMVCYAEQDAILCSKAKGLLVLKVRSCKCHDPMLLTLRSIVSFPSGMNLFTTEYTEFFRLLIHS